MADLLMTVDDRMLTDRFLHSRALTEALAAPCRPRTRRSSRCPT